MKNKKYAPKKLLEIDGSVRVYWRKGSGNINVYRYGAMDKYDLKKMIQKINSYMG